MKNKNFLTFMLVINFLLLVLIFILALKLGVFSFLSGVQWSNLLNSSLLPTFATLIVGTIAYIIYLAQKKDIKKNAANIIISEIENAERLSNKALQSNAINAFNVGESILVPNNNWKVYKHLFLKNFSESELEKIDQFYAKCESFNESFRKIKDVVPRHIIERTNNSQRIIADLAKESKSVTEFTKKKKKFIEIYINDNDIYTYSPTQPWDQLKTSLVEIENISNTSIGRRLKDLAGL